MTVPLLSPQEVSLSFTRGPRHAVRVLEDVSLDVHSGEMMAVLAQRAQGKSTLLRGCSGS